MNYFIKKYIERCNAETAAYGFRRKKNTFVRVINDVMQSFTLKKYKFGQMYTIEFGVIPLCIKIEHFDLGSYNLRSFEVDATLGDWKHDNSSYESIDQCIDELISNIKNHLIPFFNLAVCSKTALPQIILIEELFNKNRIEFLKMHNIQNKRKTSETYNVLDRVKFYMAIKNGDYCFALKNRQELLANNIKSYQSSQNYLFMTQGKLKERKVRIEKIKFEIEQLENNNQKYFQEQIDDNEKKSKKFLKDFL